LSYSDFFCVLLGIDDSLSLLDLLSCLDSAYSSFYLNYFTFLTKPILALSITIFFKGFLISVGETTFTGRGASLSDFLSTKLVIFYFAEIYCALIFYIWLTGYFHKFTFAFKALSTDFRILPNIIGPFKLLLDIANLNLCGAIGTIEQST
jgi:hypothetical protein